MADKSLQLPQLLSRKIYKTGQTRGADDDVIFQNRVLRNSTVLIPFHFWQLPILYPESETNFENGYIVLINPVDCFEKVGINNLPDLGLVLGENCLVFYETRFEWDQYNPEDLHWVPAENRRASLGGSYVARVPATTARENSGKINRGFSTTSNKGAGIRLYEYASSKTLKATRLQLEAMYWLCYDSVEIATANGMNPEAAKMRLRQVLNENQKMGLLDYDKLVKSRCINKSFETICPLCLERLTASGFYTRMAQAEGREVPDLTITEINLFHINELRYGVYNHKPYNLTWGHHHCNVVTKDSGINGTLRWMKEILDRNKSMGFEI